MSIFYAILGMLRLAPLTGYDLKKKIQESSFMPWAGNNNQIYKALLDLTNNGLVTNEVKHQDSAPTKKIYTITEAGLSELETWVQSTPEAFEIKKPFLTQFACSGIISAEALDALLIQYEDEITGRLLIEQETQSRASSEQGQPEREQVLRRLVHENVILSYKAELDWIQKTRIALERCPQTDTTPAMPKAALEQGDEMTYHIVQKEQQRYMLLGTDGTQIQTEAEAVRAAALCFENGIDRLLMMDGRLSSDFFELQTGIAGALLQKFSNYHIKAALVLTDSSRITKRFQELLYESNKGNTFRSFDTVACAEVWLLSQP